MYKTKLSNHQMFALAANFSIGSTIIAASSGIAKLAGRDAWICALLTPLIGLLFIWMYYYIGKLYPGKTLVGIFSSVFGKWPGWIISAFFVGFVCFMDVGQLMSYMGNFLQTEYMTETPLYALNSLLAIALIIGSLYGLEAIARAAEIFVFIVTSLIIFAMLMNIPNVRPENLLPVFERGPVPILKGCLSLVSYSTWPFIVLNMIYPSSAEFNLKTRNSLFLGYCLGSAINFVCTLMAILVLGSTITARSLYPTYLMAKEIDIGIIDRIEAIISFSWFLTQFTRVLLYFYAGTLGLSQLLGLKDYKKTLLPLGLVMLVISGIVYPDTAYQTKWDNTIWPPFIGTFGAVLPVFILIVSSIKGIKKKIKTLN